MEAEKVRRYVSGRGAINQVKFVLFSPATVQGRGGEKKRWSGEVRVVGVKAMFSPLLKVRSEHVFSDRVRAQGAGKAARVSEDGGARDGLDFISFVPQHSKQRA